MKPDEIKLGYLLVAAPQPNIYIGGVMVTDGRGLPIEFRYTEPIQPTKIQQILYGQVLSQYIKTEVILETLLKSLETKFKCLLVEDELFLNQHIRGHAVFRIGETKSSPLGEVGRTQAISATEILLQTTREGSPIRLQFHDNTPKEQTGADGAGEPPVAAKPKPYELLIEAGQTMDICEPMRRIEKALEIICLETGIATGATSATK
jgi:hypothetical protein